MNMGESATHYHITYDLSMIMSLTGITDLPFMSVDVWSLFNFCLNMPLNFDPKNELCFIVSYQKTSKSESRWYSNRWEIGTSLREPQNPKSKKDTIYSSQLDYRCLKMTLLGYFWRFVKFRGRVEYKNNTSKFKYYWCEINSVLFLVFISVSWLCNFFSVWPAIVVHSLLLLR